MDMTTAHPLRILRMPDLRTRYPRGRSTVYVDILRGVLPPPVVLGPRCSGWPEHEIDAIIAARISGATDDEVRRLVADILVARRRAA